MTLLLTLLLTASIAQPVEFGLKPIKSSYAAGEPIRVELYAKNVSKSDVVIAKAIWDGAPAASASARLFRNGRQVHEVGESSIRSVQVMVSNLVDKDRFTVLKPGGMAVLYWKSITGEMDFHGHPPGLKESYKHATTTKLTKGEYKLEVANSFDKEKIVGDLSKFWRRKIEFAPGAQSLWDRAIDTKQKFTKTLRIK